jgi:hypothetical protein
MISPKAGRKCTSANEDFQGFSPLFYVRKWLIKRRDIEQMDTCTLSEGVFLG